MSKLSKSNNKYEIQDYTLLLYLQKNILKMTNFQNKK